LLDVPMPRKQKQKNFVPTTVAVEPLTFYQNLSSLT
jgi:hypothetical protein